MAEHFPSPRRLLPPLSLSSAGKLLFFSFLHGAPARVVHPPSLLRAALRPALSSTVLCRRLGAHPGARWCPCCATSARSAVAGFSVREQAMYVSLRKKMIHVSMAGGPRSDACV
uniref:Uncharacterized protein n=1 Tax=Zea mays TaxID=4577 RepID=A0A804LEI0_MAIZE